MVNKSYMTDQPQPPSRLKRLMDQKAIPVAINLFGSMEEWVERMADAVRVEPVASLLAIVGGSALATSMLMPRRRRNASR